MSEVGIRALKQNASAVVARAAGGEPVTITDHHRPVAQLTPIAATMLQRLIDAGQARPAKRRLADIGSPTAGTPLSDALAEMRAEERF
jgi:prevent-host-death family protein